MAELRRALRVVDEKIDWYRNRRRA
jgi:hypothetical protein